MNSQGIFGEDDYHPSNNLNYLRVSPQGAIYVEAIDSIAMEQIQQLSAVISGNTDDILIISGDLYDLTTFVETNSASWSAGGAVSADLATLSAAIDTNTADIVIINSTISANSGNWDSTYSTVLSNSASWSAGGGGSGGVYDLSFTSGDLVSDILTVTHNLGVQRMPFTISDNANKSVIPDEMIFINSNVASVDLTSFDVSGTWNAVLGVGSVSGESGGGDYMPLSGGVFTGTVAGITPVLSADLATKNYVDLADSSLQTQIDGNDTDIISLSSAIDTNNTGISNNDTDIISLSSAIDTNITDISNIESTVISNSGNWDSTYSTVLSNSSDWSDHIDVTNLSAAIDANIVDISANTANIQVVSGQVDINTSNISDNDTDIISLSSAIDTNITGISDNDTDIISLSSAIDTNITDISNVTSTLQSNSADWDSTFSTVGTNSGDWGDHSIVSDRMPISGGVFTGDVTYYGNNGDTSSTAYGTEALSSTIAGGIRNTGFGFRAGMSISTGDENVCIGYAAGGGITNQNYSTIIGTKAGGSLVGGENTLVGQNVMGNTSSGAYNVAMGVRALRYGTGDYNVAIGYDALNDNATNSGTQNTAVGRLSIANLTTGDYNSAVGSGSLNSVTTGERNSALGINALRLTTTGANYETYDRSTGIGQESRCSGSNQIQLGYSTETTYAYGSVQNRSDIRDKADVRDIELGLDFINSLRPVDFKWNYRDDYIETPEGEDEVIFHENDGSKKRSRYHHGFIAQEVEAIIEETSTDFGGFQDHARNGGDDVKSLGYEEFIAPMVKAIQELTTQNASLLARIEELEGN